MSDHKITWTHRSDYVTTEVTCTAQEGADCRMSCVGGCDSWELNDHAHALADQGHCNAVEWFVGFGDPVEFFAGPEGTPVHAGPVDVRWNGHDWEWDYTNQPAPTGATT